MAPPLKKGLEYFPLVHEIFDDENFVEVQNTYGPLGEVIFFRLLSLIFQNGYYYRFDSMDKLANKLIKSIGNRWARDKKTVTDIILFLAKNNLFSAELMRENVITSREVQLRYLKAMERRQSKIVEYSLLEKNDFQEGLVSAAKNGDNVAISSDNVTISSDNVCNNPPKKRENKTIEYKGNGAAAPAAPPPAPDLKNQLIETYGWENVVNYEQRFDKWKAKKGVNIKADKYSTIAKWLKQDGVQKPVNKSSFDMDAEMNKIKSRYKEG